MTEFEKEGKKPLTFTDKQKWQPVEDQEESGAAGIDETAGTWRYRVQDPGKYERSKVKPLMAGVQVTYAKVKCADRWEIQSYIFDKKVFKTPDSVKQWLDQHLKSQISFLTDFKTWNEYRRRAVNAYVEISEVR
jgi:hypothetical protein